MKNKFNAVDFRKGINIECKEMQYAEMVKNLFYAFKFSYLETDAG